MGENLKICKCGDKRCLGWMLLHEKEMIEIEQTKESIRKEHGDVRFDLKPSPSSGELFTKFYELHIIKNERETIEPHKCFLFVGEVTCYQEITTENCEKCREAFWAI